MKEDEKNFVTVKFTKNYLCYNKGNIKDVTPQFAHALTTFGVAKRVKAPKRDKQMSEAPMEKTL